MSIATLLAFSLATNLLFLKFGHIGYSFAIHAGWNLTRFGGAYERAGVALTETDTIALIEGSLLALGASALLLLAVIAVDRVGRSAGE